MKNYKLTISKAKDNNYYCDCDVPFVTLNDEGNYFLVFKDQAGAYSAIDLESGQQTSAQHPRLNGLFGNFSRTLGKIVEAEIQINQ